MVQGDGVVARRAGDGVARNQRAGNNVSGFTPDPSYGRYGQIYLSPATSGGPAAAHNLVVCANRSDTVFDGGTNNTVIGCTSVTAPTAAAAPAAPAMDRLALKAKPRLP